MGAPAERDEYGIGNRLIVRIADGRRLDGLPTIGFPDQFRNLEILVDRKFHRPAMVVRHGATRRQREPGHADQAQYAVLRSGLPAASGFQSRHCIYRAPGAITPISSGFRNRSLVHRKKISKSSQRRNMLDSRRR